MQAVILAGGKGTRLQPLTHSIPKPMVPINDRPFLAHQVEMIKNSGIDSVVMCVGYLKEQIMDYFKDGSSFGIAIEYSVESRPLGTGGAIKNAGDLLSEDFIIVYGDSYLEIPYRELYEKHSKAGKVGTLAVYDNAQFTDVHNNIAIDKRGLVTKYVKNGGDADLNYVEAGASAFSKRLLDMMPEESCFSLEESVYPRLIQVRQLAAFITDQRFYDIGTPKRLEEAKRILR